MNNVDILLASFNGEAFLQEQWASILGQSYKNWRLFTRDDESIDSTVEIIQELIRQEPEKILFADETLQVGGACATFAILLEKSTSDYVMFCDQDDVWLPNKISKTLETMKSAEQQYGTDTPLLVHTDLQVVDEQLQTIAPSLLKYQHLSPQSGSQLNRLLPQNVVTGCTVMINRPLVKLATPIPNEAIMHDWWLALVAALFGQIVFLNEPTMFYRQHSRNCIGAKRWGLRRILQQMQQPGVVRESMLNTMRQAQAILDRYCDQIPTASRTTIKAYAALPFMPKTERIRTVFRYRFFRQGMVRSIGFLANLIMLNRDHN